MYLMAFIHVSESSFCNHFDEQSHELNSHSVQKRD